MDMLNTNYSKIHKDVLSNIGLFGQNKGTSTGSFWFDGNHSIVSISPIDGLPIASVEISTPDAFEEIVRTSFEAFQLWRTWPAPKRGQVIKQFGNLLQINKLQLSNLIAIEMGKSMQEALGEVQEMIDICDFAVGLSRQLYGITISSERQKHRLYEQWHPLGIVGIISAFNFPAAVWCWNAALAWVCGNVCVWKPSEKTPLVSLACQQLIARVFKENNVPEGVSCLITGGKAQGEWIVQDNRISLISATGSTLMGKFVGTKVAERFGRCILELGGNNAVLVTEKANLKLALRAVVFGAIGTAGQRCTSIRRVFVQEAIYDNFIAQLLDNYKKLRIGNPIDVSIHMGPLIDETAVEAYLNAIQAVKEQGGKMLLEGGKLEDKSLEGGYYVSPSIALVTPGMEIIKQEVFAPLLFVCKYSTIESAIQMQNDVPQGLSSAIITQDLVEAELFLSAEGSDCGIVNVNMGTSGAEIGGAFGGEKETGGGRESGSDAWKMYMRRQTVTINFGGDLPLAQGIQFSVS